MRRNDEQTYGGSGWHSGHEPLYQVSEVAELLRVSKQTIYRAINDGELPAVRIRSRKLVPESAVTAVLRRAASAGGASPDAPGPVESLASTTQRITE
ncbi:helix-turn-helix domain-containing protein [Saccharothrix obliqua]|uniref:helix-turn-helix domain-containing protein n=1 Tax=Saccharothrix obliqua TaxID=2861747 RepID=UPI001C5EE842|nr:helix-turn-helix domain-containing protein [Saccharothrix obliqua]MBW4722145.1 helix-turn-helix domain-containing protein [Saccharothrix obliqua]